MEEQLAGNLNGAANTTMNEEGVNNSLDTFAQDMTSKDFLTVSPAETSETPLFDSAMTEKDVNLVPAGTTTEGTASSSMTPHDDSPSQQRSLRVKKKACKTTNKTLSRNTTTKTTQRSNGLVDSNAQPMEIDPQEVYAIVDSGEENAGKPEVNMKQRRGPFARHQDANYVEGDGVDDNAVIELDLSGEDPNLEAQASKDEYLQEGDLVFCPWPGKNPDYEKWYWGNIETKIKEKETDFYVYAIKFTDGDYLPEISARHLIGIDEYRRLVKRGLLNNDEPPPTKGKGRKRRAEEDTSIPSSNEKRTSSRRRSSSVPTRSDSTKSKPYTPEELHHYRCNHCLQCRKDDCGVCKMCKMNAKRDATQDPIQGCYQKMCMAIAEDKKSQPCEGFPPGWVFFFDDEKRNEKHKGLLIVGPTGRRFRNTKSVQNVYRPDVCDPDLFYKSVGLPPEGVKPKGNQSKPDGVKSKVFQSKPEGVKSRGYQSKQDSSRMMYPPTLTLEQLWDSRCSYCDNCRKPDCKTCDSCIRSQGREYRTEICLQKMCLNLSVHQKKQPAQYFPDGWYFYFDVGSDSRDGLVILGPDRKRYRTVEKALAQNKDVMETEGPSALNFYDFVGLERPSNDTTTEGISLGVDSYHLSRPAEDSVQVPFHLANKKLKHKPQETEGTALEEVVAAAPTPFNPTELYKEKCSQCSFCIKPDCKRCITCLLNSTRTRRHREVCLRKLCGRIPIEKKQQPADGFPRGWCFIFEDPLDAPNSEANDESHPDLLGLRMVAPKGLKFRSIVAAINRYQGSLTPSIDKFYEQLGASMYKVIESDLVGEGYCTEWSNVRGERRTIYGRITKVEKHYIEGSNWCTVTYNEMSRSSVNSIYNSCTVLSVPKTERIRLACAMGGVHAFRKKMNVSKELPIASKERPESWLAPEMRQERLQYDQPDGNHKPGEFLQGLPRLTLTVRGFQLIFTAKKSGIPNAGNGVFVKCVSMQPPHSSQLNFELPAGELLDLGVYAPFRVQDKKKEHIFLLKNFVHNLMCEEYCFETTCDRNEHTFDITDDWTGELHDIARRHVPAYVNEIGGNDNEIPIVHARHDCEGALHYLLGHDHRDYGPFKLMADGIEKEIFVDYGAQYEKVRLRKGFSRLSGEEQEKALKNLEKDDMEYLDEIYTFNAHEVHTSIQYFDGLLIEGKRLKMYFAERCLIVAILLKKRAHSIMLEFADLDKEGVEPSSFCDNGVTEFDMPKMVGEARKLVSRLFSLWNNDQVIKDRLLEHTDFTKLLQGVLEVTDLAALDASKFRSLLEHA